ncbi:type I-C CRISPR-associated protein Cas8c/Csd1 [uncultured Ruminococcus sp.]|uniref:type I-C CRISPR-associated protein Cas8c/Csd1 n=1 Tax=uncultured Ruminococcus sp. TaxID=165186 RepID=UPI002631DE20|nr:type I-C CRISPR-associated protein Cas8c/Csd1 [uncultured Ruminococcus sp.]
MSWTNELYQIYEYNSNREFEPNEPVMLPVAHSTANAQIELTIGFDGNFKSARAVEKSEAVTVIPATENSATRSSGICAMPYADKLIYIAGDYSQYAEGKKADNSGHFTNYMNQLRAWLASEYSHPFVRALYSYLEKKHLIADLVEAGVIKTDETTGKFKDKEKISGIAQEDCFVRIVINTSEDRIETWKDKSLQESFISFNSDLMGEKQLCYASGEYAAATYKHPSKIRNSGDKAKIMSTNDESGFTYRGRFSDKEQAVSVGYEYSQKIHNALRWLREKQGRTIDSLTVIVWASAMQDIPKCSESLIDDSDFDDLPAGKEAEIPSTVPKYMDLLKKRIFGVREKLEPNTKVMIMGLDAATPGRINISMYSELESSQYLANIEKWHSETAWLRFSGKLKKKMVNSFSVYDIIKYAFGTEQGAFVDCDKRVMRDNIIRLLNCITNGARLPSDIVNALYQKASTPLAYDKDYNHRAVLETACGMIRKQRIENGKGDVSMAYDPSINDRSYLYGCLLAIADKAENEAFDPDERNVRVTNARRYWNSFSQRPYTTWCIIEERLRPYLNKLGKAQVRYGKWINEITSKMDAAGFADNTRLEPMYLLGYHNFTEYMYNGNTNKED